MRSAARSRPTAMPGLAVTIDIGNRDDVHPTNKQEVGRRLARAARHVVFGEKSVGRPARSRVSATRSGADVVVQFAGNGGRHRRL